MLRGRTRNQPHQERARPDTARTELADARASQGKGSATEKNEEQVRLSQRLEAIGRLAGGIAHDLNNLMTVINGYSELVLQSLGKRSRLRQEVEEIRKAGQRAAVLTRQLLAFSRRQVLQPRVLDLNALLGDLSQMLRRLIPEDIELVSAPGPALGYVKADAGQIEQVIVNLALNARDAMPKGGKLIIETANVELDEAYAARHVSARPGPHVMLAVSDTGCGIDAATLPHIFEPFFTTKEVGKGTGLGLATVYGIVKQSNGNIWAYSELGRGTTFKVYLPRIEGKLDPRERRDVPVTNRTGTETVLLAEDEEMLRKYIRNILQSHGYKVIEAKDGDEAMELYRRNREQIELLLTDVTMPQMSGVELVDRLTKQGSDLNVIYMSGYTDCFVNNLAILEPGVAFLEKPFTEQELLKSVRAALEGSASARRNVHDKDAFREELAI